ncbi:NYN domain-containing protein [Halarcobacter sp.]|uniref:NYN domain-containing protein n=1 Tax=Halarcobacter sp. TaxID=2321133 RepID=UPI002AABC5A1|nr:NYN domain-containing protein [Halarcobacter sp.]
MQNKKIAIFFDCENISCKYVDEIFTELAKIGEITISKAYHDWSNPSSESWRTKISEFAIDPVQIFPNMAGKNSADIKLTIDVVNTTVISNIDIIVLVSSDSDFTSLAIDIKNKNIECIGFGENKTPESFRKAFSVFFELPRINKKQNSIELLKSAINFTKDEDGFANVALVSQYLKNKNSSLNPQNYGLERWSDIFKEKNKDFEIEYRNDRSALFVKVK